MRSQVDELLQHAYRPYRTLPDLLHALLHALTVQGQLAGGSLRLRGAGSVNIGPAQSQVISTRSVVSRSLPITYASEPIGELHVAWPRDTAQTAVGLCEEFALRCAYLIKRYEVQSWAEKRLGRPLLLVGVSDALHRLEVFVEKAAHSMLPVLLKGEFGTEKALLAAAVHCCGPNRDGPFVEVNCSDPADLPAQWFEQASGGTLFFNGIDELARPLQSQLPQYMHSRLGQWLAVPDACEIRVIASATADLGQRVLEGRFSRQLLAELDFLAIAVPPLRQRPGDIHALLVAALERHRCDAHLTCTDALIEISARHSWPDNLFEMERVVARLAVMTSGQPIHEVDVQRHTPWLFGTGQAEAAGAAADVVTMPTPVVTSVPLPQPLSPVSASHWVRCALTCNLGELSRLHDALRKALLYLAEHYAEPISLGQLADQAHVSPSHLGYLFRSVLSTTFKPLLQRIRIEKAKEIFSSDTRRRITEVALSVGFGDLSHFEKSFRRIVGQSPREFKRGPAPV
jgi:AraC-like DNA-binding protein